MLSRRTHAIRPKTFDFRPVRNWMGLLAAVVTVVAAAFGIWRLPAVQEQILAGSSVAALREKCSAPDASARACLFLGRALVREKDYNGAAESFQKALARADPDDALRPAILGELAETLVQLGQYEAAVPLLTQALNQDASIVPAHLALGRILAHRKLYEPAVLEFQAVTMLEPKNAVGWYELGRTRNDGKSPGAAEAALRTAVTLAPRESRYWQELGHSLAYRSRFSEAATAFARAVQLDPSDRSAAVCLARTRTLQARTPEEYRKARGELARFAPGGGDNGFFSLQLGVLDLQFGDLRRAAEELERAAALDPNSGEALYSLAMVKTRLGAGKEAAAVMARFRQVADLESRATELRKRLAVYPKDPVLNMDLGRVLERQQKYVEAFEQYRFMSRNVPDSGEAAEALRRLSRRPEVAAAFSGRPSP